MPGQGGEVGSAPPATTAIREIGHNPCQRKVRLSSTSDANCCTKVCLNFSGVPVDPEVRGPAMLPCREARSSPATPPRAHGPRFASKPEQSFQPAEIE